MKIHDSLRQECMPEMVYSICKLAGSKSYHKDEIKRLITLNSSDVAQFNKVYLFAKECEFIEESSDNIVIANFTDKELSSFEKFRHRIFIDIFKNSNNTFTELAKWYLTQNTEIFTYKTAQDFTVKASEVNENIKEEYVLGFRFWMVALGIAMFQKSGGGLTLVFATNNILLNWVIINKPFKKGHPILASDFFRKLQDDCPVFANCINENNINLSLSMGLRVLEINKIIELKYVADSGDIWHLVESISNPKTNHITEIIVR